MIINDENVSVNRAGGASYEIKDSATKLITMCGGSFFMEPRYYSVDKCVPNRKSDGNFDKLKERLSLSYNKVKKIIDINVNNCEELDDVSVEIISTACNILNGKNPEDLFKIAHWLRCEMNIRLTPQVLLVLASRHPVGSKFVREYAYKIVQRPDEIKTVILLHRFFFGMKNLKRCLCRGLSDVMAKFSEQALLKYNSSGFPTWKDVLFMIYRKKDFPLSKELYEYFTYNKIDEEKIPIINSRKKLSNCNNFNDAKKYIKESYANWEVVLSQFGNTKEVWEYLISNNLVGYMALLRNLRNIINVNVNSETIKMICEKISDENEVKNSKQLPFRFLMAYDIINNCSSFSNINVGLLSKAIDKAVNISAENVPIIKGKTVVFADNSGSMNSPVSGKSNVSCYYAANILAGICAYRCEDVRVVAFGTEPCEVVFNKKHSILNFVSMIRYADTQGCGTNVDRCINWMLNNNIFADRVILLSDMQCWKSNYSGTSFNSEWKKYKELINSEAWLHSVNLCGYGDSVIDEKFDKVNLVGGFSEKILSMLNDTEGNSNNCDNLPTLEQIRQKW